VRKLTNKFVELTRIERGKDRPPVCDISWGHNDSDFPFSGVVTELNQEFTLFESDGRPVRANLTVSFLEFEGWEEGRRRADPEFTTYVVKRGDELSSIAAKVYGDPAAWRVIAEANRLDDPRGLEVGRTLNIPRNS
jgi:nucleoid-associated protein YgaU